MATASSPPRDAIAGFRIVIAAHLGAALVVLLAWIRAAQRAFSSRVDDVEGRDGVASRHPPASACRLRAGGYPTKDSSWQGLIAAPRGRRD